MLLLNPSSSVFEPEKPAIFVLLKDQFLRTSAFWIDLPIPKNIRILQYGYLKCGIFMWLIENKLFDVRFVLLIPLCEVGAFSRPERFLTDTMNSDWNSTHANTELQICFPARCELFVKAYLEHDLQPGLFVKRIFNEEFIIITRKYKAVYCDPNFATAADSSYDSNKIIEKKSFNARRNLVTACWSCLSTFFCGMPNCSAISL